MRKVLTKVTKSGIKICSEIFVKEIDLAKEINVFLKSEYLIETRKSSIRLY
jgi:hypothetical protein